MKVKTGFNLGVVLACLAFGPRENRDFFFRTPADRLYGEVEVFKDEVGTWSVARNVSGESVELVDSTMVRVWSADLEDGTYYTSETDRKIYSRSLAVVERKNDNLSSARNIRIGNAHPRTPRRLSIATEAEAFHEFFWPGIVVLLSVALTYMVNDYSWECGSPIRDIVESEE